MEYYSMKDFWSFILKGKYIVILSVAACLLLGLFFYKITPNTYESSVSFIILGNEDQSQSRLGGLASLAGINAVTAPGIPTSSYEHIALSTPLLADISRQKIEYLGDSILIGNYITQRMNISLKNRIFNNFTDEKPEIIFDNSIAEDYDRIFKHYDSIGVQPVELKGALGASINTLKSIIQFQREEKKPLAISTTTGDPHISAIITKLVIEKLEAFVAVYNQSNQEDNSSFFETEFKKSEKEVNRLRNLYAAEQDLHINANKAKAKTGVERLSLEYSQALKSHNELKAQLDASRLQKEKAKSYFVIIEQPKVLNIGFPTSPRLAIYISLSIFLGIFLGLGILILRNIFQRD